MIIGNHNNNNLFNAKTKMSLCKECIYTTRWAMPKNWIERTNGFNRTRWFSHL